MFKKKILISLFLSVAIIATACSGGGKQNKTDNNSSAANDKSDNNKNSSIKNTYWIANQEDGDWKRSVELIFNEDGSFHCRSITGGDIDSYCSHVDADSYTWIQNSDMIDLEFNTDNPHKKVTFYAQILNKGDKIRCSDMFEISEESLTFIKQDKMPKLTSIEEDSDKLIGEWELVACGDYSPHDMTADEGTEFESTMNIYKKNDKMYADYHFIREKGSGKSDIEQMGISFNKKPLTLNCLNEFWSASFNKAVIPEGADQKIKLNVNFTLVGDNKLLLIEEDPESDFDGYPTLVYLRKGTKEYDDRENYFYHKTVTVSDINELIQNLYANTKIILKEGTYNFSDLDSETSIDEYGESDSGSNYFNYLLYTDHIRLEAEDGAKVSILTNSSTSNVLEFFGGNDISFKGLTFGHNVEKGFCTGNVLAFSSCDGIRIEDCNLFGCGTYGISSNGVSNLSVVNTQIYECSYGLLELNNTYDSTFKNCVLRDSEGYNQFEMNYCGNISFEDCQITGNKAEDMQKLFIASSGSNGIVFKNCNFKNNSYKTKSNEDIQFIDCTFDDNK